MLAATYSIVQSIVKLSAITAMEFGLFFSLVWFATRQSVTELFKSFSKMFVESLALVGVTTALLLLLKLKAGATLGSSLIFFEQMYAVILFLALVLMSCIHYQEFKQDRYRLGFFGLLVLVTLMLIFSI